MGLERAVLAVALARPRQRQREIAREGDAAAHPAQSTKPMRWLASSRCWPLPAAPDHRRGPPELERDADARLHAQRRARRDLPGRRARLRPRRGRRPRGARRRASTDSVTLLLTGRADFAILDIHDLAIARAKATRPRRRDGDRPAPAGRGASPAPGCARRASWRASASASPACRPTSRCCARSSRGDGGDPERVRRVTIGFEAVPALVAGQRRRGDRVLERRGRRDARGAAVTMLEFRLDDYGAPAYPELVLTVTRETLQDDPPLVRATVRALQRGYRDRSTPSPRSGDARAASRASTARRAAAQLDAVAPRLQAGAAESAPSTARLRSGRRGSALRDRAAPRAAGGLRLQPPRGEADLREEAARGG